MDVQEFEAKHRIIPIPLRSDLTVKIQLPTDLTRKEAEKIGRVVLAYAANPAEAKE